MAFNAKKIAPVYNNGRSGDIPMAWVYDNVAGDTVTTAGFIPAGYGVRDLDTVKVYASDGTFKNYIASVTTNVVTLSEMAVKSYTVLLSDISTAGSAYFVSPVAGKITKITSALGGAIATADAVVTGKINTVAITDGELTVAYTSSAGGDIDEVEPSALNVVAVGDLVEFATDGASTNAIPLYITIDIA